MLFDYMSVADRWSFGKVTLSLNVEVTVLVYSILKCEMQLDFFGWQVQSSSDVFLMTDQFVAFTYDITRFPH